ATPGVDRKERRDRQEREEGAQASLLSICSGGAPGSAATGASAGASLGGSTPNTWASSPVSYISVTMSQPPTSSPLTNSWGIVGQLEIALSSWRMRGSGRVSTAA